MLDVATADPFAIAADILDPPTTSCEWFEPNPDPDFDGDPGRVYVEDGVEYVRDRARPKQRPPEGEWFAWLLMTGRGFGKTRTAAEYVDDRARGMRRGDQILIAGRTPSDVRTFSLYGAGGLLTHHPDIDYSPSNRELTWPNGVKGVIRSGANPEEFRGYSGDLAWLDEFAAWDYPKNAWENLIFGTREADPRIVITTTPKPIQVIKDLMTNPAVRVVTGSTLENRANLSERWMKTVVIPIMGTRLGRQEIDAEVLEEAEGALWTRALIEANRVKLDEVPDLVRVVVGVDPQGRAGNPRETGIVSAGISARGVVYVTRDGSLSAKPAQWGERVVHVYRTERADRVVGESNFGGEMVEHVVRTVDKNTSYKDVHASRGKRVRAEPVSSLYERGMVKHVGAFPELENEQCTWDPEESWSPNRLDALVWAVTELAIDPEEEPPKGNVPWTPGRRFGR